MGAIVAHRFPNMPFVGIILIGKHPFDILRRILETATVWQVRNRGSGGKRVHFGKKSLFCCRTVRSYPPHILRRGKQIPDEGRRSRNIQYRIYRICNTLIFNRIRFNIRRSPCQKHHRVGRTGRHIGHIGQTSSSFKNDIVNGSGRIVYIPIVVIPFKIEPLHSGMSAVNQMGKGSPRRDIIQCVEQLDTAGWHISKIIYRWSKKHTHIIHPRIPHSLEIEIELISFVLRV